MTTLNATETIPTITTDLPSWQPATWENYLSYRDRDNPHRIRLFFDGKKLLREWFAKELTTLVSATFSLCDFLFGSVAPNEQ